MTRDDFVKLIGADKDNSDYVPVALMLKSGYAISGHYNAALNKGFSDIVVMLNSQLLELRGDSTHGQPVIEDFSDFLEEVVLANSTGKKVKKKKATGADFGKQVPIAAIPFSEIAVIYPVSQIETLIRRAEKKGTGELPRFLDLGQSETLALLKTKLW